MEIPLKKNGRINTGLIKKNLHLISYIKSISGIDENECIIKHIFHAINPNCETVCVCGSDLIFKGSKGYTATCGKQKCKDLKVKSAVFNKYNVNNVFELTSTKEKTKQSNLEKYGVEHYSKTLNFKEKSKQTCFKNHGVEYPSQSNIVKQKILKTNLEKYGVEYATQSNIVKEKTKQSNLEKYGVAHPSMLKHNRDLCNDTRKITENDKRPGRFILDDYDFLKELIHNKSVNLTLIAQQYDVDPNWLGRKIKEFNLNPKHNNFSKPHYEIYEFIKNITDKEIILNSKSHIKPLEIDILIDNLVIELNGIYWHSYSKLETLQEKNKHVYKLNKCLEKGYSFFSLTDMEWNNKKDICKSIIKNKLGYSNKIFARKCNIREVEYKESIDFLNKNHLKGAPKIRGFRYGLYYNDELVSLIVISNSRFNNKYDWEIIRYATKINFSVVGGFSKLISYFKKNNQGSIISYSDRDKFDGSSYIASGFKLLKTNSPSYYYWKNGVKYNRLKFQKHKLQNILENYDKKLTEAENMFNNGFRRYWDCGSNVWVM